MRHGHRVKILKASIPSYWYADMIGQEFDVATIMGDMYLLIQQYSDEQFLPTVRYINVRDVKIIRPIRYTEHFSYRIEQDVL